MKALRSTFLLNAAAVAISSQLLLGGCSGPSLVSDNVAGGKKTAPAEINANASDNGAGSAATVPQGNQNEFQGVIEPELIAAAYLVCFKIDAQGNQIACNLYDTKTDKRIPVETLPNASWRAYADGAPIPAIDSSSLGSQFKLAFAAGPVPCIATYMGQSPKIYVAFSLPGTNSPTYFSGSLGSMPMLKDMGAFGVVKNLKITPSPYLGPLSGPSNGSTNLSSFLGKLKSKSIDCQNILILTSILIPCVDKSVFYIPETLNSVWMEAPDQNHCTMVKNLAFAIWCSN